MGLSRHTARACIAAQAYATIPNNPQPFHVQEWVRLDNRCYLEAKGTPPCPVLLLGASYSLRASEPAPRPFGQASSGLPTSGRKRHYKRRRR